MHKIQPKLATYVKRFNLFAIAFTVAASQILVALPANAQTPPPTNWERQIDGLLSQYDVVTNTDESATVCGQYSATQAFSTVDKNNTGSTNIPNSGDPQPSCDYNSTVDTDGIIYSAAYGDNGFTMYLAAYNTNGSERWHVSLPGCPNNNRVLYSLKVGADGNIYVLSGNDSECDTGQRYFLAKVKPQDGSILFNKSLGTDFWSRPSGLMPYDQGIALMGGTNTPKVRYYDYNGTQLSSTNINLGSGETADSGDVSITHTGRVYSVINKDQQSTQECQYTNVSTKVIAFEPDGPLLDQSSNPKKYDFEPCERAGQIKTMPGGGFAISTAKPYGADSKIIAVNSNLQKYGNDFLPTTGTIANRVFGDTLVGDFLVDNNGNVIVKDSYWFNSQYRSQLSILNSNLEPQSVTHNDTIYAGTSIGLSKDRVYLANNLCSPTCTNLHAISAPGVGMDYPRARVMGVQPVTIPKLDYLALGDSFSSGEGDLDSSHYAYGTNGDRPPEFGIETDEEKCHISKLSYPYLLAQTMNIPSNKFKSVACSGAKIKDVQGNLDPSLYLGQDDRIKVVPEGQRDEVKLDALQNFKPGREAQIEFVKEYQPKLVTVGVSGNDIGFSNILKPCLAPGSCSHSVASDEREGLGQAIQNQYSKLKELYEKIHTVSPDTKIFAVGYPKIVKKQTACAVNVPLDDNERDLADETVNFLNQVVQKAAQDAGVGYLDINDGLAGKELCSGSTEGRAVNGAGFGGDVFKLFLNESMHPNQIGQGMIASKINARYSNLLNYNYCTDNSTNCPGSNQSVPPIPSWFGVDDNVLRRLYDGFSQLVLHPISDVINLPMSLLAPGSNLHIEIHTENVSLGDFTVDQNGNVNANVTIPSSVPPGFHTLHLKGNNNGNSVDYYRDVIVTSTNTTDVDGDGVIDTSDPCLFITPANQDTDYDGTDDACDAFIDTGKLLFASDQTGNSDIYLMNHDGSGKVNLTNTTQNENSPTLSPNGTKILFERSNDLWVMDTNGITTKLTTTANNLEGSFSPDGTKITFKTWRDGNDEIYVMNQDGSNQTRITNNSTPDSLPKFSPDGTKLAFTRTASGNADIYTTNTDSTNEANISNNASLDTKPSWSPDGAKIVFQTNRDSHNEIYKMNTDGTNQTRLTNTASNVSNETPTFSLGGTKIVYSTSQASDLEIAIINDDGTNPTTITNNSTNEQNVSLVGANTQFTPYNEPDSGPSSTTHKGSDFNGDIKDDILWYGPGSAADDIWHGDIRANQFNKNYDVNVSGTYTPFAGDFNGDGKDDVFWYGPGSAADSIWYGTSTPGSFSSTSVTVAGTFKPQIGDFNGDGKDDILWYGPGSADDALWYGTATKGSFSGVAVTVAGTFTPATGDFNGDGKDDIFWYGVGTATDASWYGTSTKGSFSSAAVSISGTYKPASGDFDGDGKDDIFWYGTGTNPDKLWFGTTTKGTFTNIDTQVDGTYAPVVGNFDGDAKDDILWYGSGTAADKLWYGTSLRNNFITSDINLDGVYTPVF